MRGLWSCSGSADRLEVTWTSFMPGLSSRHPAEGREPWPTAPSKLVIPANAGIHGRGYHQSSSFPRMRESMAEGTGVQSTFAGVGRSRVGDGRVPRWPAWLLVARQGTGTGSIVSIDRELTDSLCRSRAPEHRRTLVFSPRAQPTPANVVFTPSTSAMVPGLRRDDDIQQARRE